MTERTYSPKELASQIGVSPKVLRAYLRKDHARDAEAKNTTWVIPESVAKVTRAHFAKNRAKD